MNEWIKTKGLYTKRRHCHKCKKFVTLHNITQGTYWCSYCGVGQHITDTFPNLEIKKERIEIKLKELQIKLQEINKEIEQDKIAIKELKEFKNE